MEYRFFYERHLPHYQPPGATLFVTFRLAGTIPAQILQQLLDESERAQAALDKITDAQERARQTDLGQRRLFAKWDAALDKASCGPFWLQDQRIATLVSESLHYGNGQTYDLDAFCIMPNHVHVVFTPLAKPDGAYQAASDILHSIKSYTAHQANRVLERQGAFWQHESYDHVIRSEAEWRRITTYVLNNPVAAGLVQRCNEWKWSYCRHTM